MKKLKKYIEFITTRVKLIFQEKKFKSDDVTLKYMLDKNSKSNILIVVSSACTKVGIKARCNYVRTLNKCNASKLFILDNFGFDGRGAYYLGYNGGTEIYKASCKLINKIKQENNIDKIIFCGTSKGGFASLNFMLNFKNSDCIIGAPQYKLGNYLLAPALFKTQEYIMKDKTEENTKYFNDVLKCKIEQHKNEEHKVFLHYSNKEHTYDEHIKYLIEDLKCNNYDLIEDCQLYENHWDVSYYYPRFLLGNLKNHYDC